MPYHKDRGDYDSNYSKQYLWIAEISESNQSRVTVCNNPRINQSDNCNEQANATADRFFNGQRNCIYNRFSATGSGQKDKDQTGDKNSGQASLPGVPVCATDSECKERIQAHTRCLRQRIVG